MPGMTVEQLRVHVEEFDKGRWGETQAKQRKLFINREVDRLRAAGELSDEEAERLRRN